MPQQLTIISVNDVIDYIYKTYHDERQKGDMWERVSRYYLLSDPLYSEIIGKVWLWADAPTNDFGAGGGKVQDTGIDLVAEDLENPGQFWAIQCKCYDQGKSLPYKECSTFWSTAQADKRYSRYMLISTTELISKNIVDMVKKTPTVLIAPSDMQAANIDWSGVLTDEKSLKERVTFDLREHQEIAVKSINKAFDEEGYDRCKAVMACGTGKTLMSLRLAEGRANGGLVLFAAPSIALVSQAMREWTNQARVDLRTLVVCSDAQASSLKEADTILDTTADLAYPATTDPSKLVERYRAIRDKSGDCMIAVCSTYQSMQVIEDAQKMGLPEFDLIVCDEAHRTTGYKANGESNEDISSFLIVHDNDRVHGSKRLYMTATPRIYGDQAKRIGAKQDYVLTSMDDESIFGKTAYEIPFSEAVERDLLCDYRVVVMAVREEVMPRDMQRLLSDGSELQMDEAAKIIGCYKGLATHGEVSQQRLDAMFEEDSYEIPDFFLIDTLDEENIPETEREIKPLNRAVGFCLDIKSSKRVDEMFGPIIEQYLKDAREEERYDLYCSLDHVDGSMNSKMRHSKLDWLAGGQDDEECRILTNARCLAEGVDVPSLDAVIFFSPRKSEVDVVQAVGRVMRSFTNPKTGEKKKLGYIILPVFIPEGKLPEEALNDNKTFDVVWKVLQALRSHDERIEAYVNSLQFRKKKEKKAGIGRAAGNGGTEVIDGGDGEQFQIDFNERLAEAIYTKAVDRVGTRIYWDSWAEDVAHIAERHIEQIKGAISSDPAVRKGFDSFIKGLRDSLNPGISENDAIEMIAQHMITLPVFDALFGDFEFAKSNPVSVAITEFLKSLAGHGVGDMSESDEAALDALYSSVARRAKMARTDNGRQALIKNLYEEFFRKAFRATTDKLGIVYTPDEIINYMLHATDRVLRREFGKSLADEGVHILDPFAGTGSFTARLIEDEELMPLDKLPYKYAHELHSNEILLLAYYIQIINIEYAYHSRTGEYKEFEGALLTDTFQMSEQHNKIDELFFVDNSIRLLDQRNADIKIVISNPPWSVGQREENDNNRNEDYPSNNVRIAQTYARHSTNRSTKKGLYDSYIRAIRWSSDRIKNAGIVCLVTNSGWLRASGMDGMRRCLAREFSSIYVYDLRGNQRTQGETSRREGGKVFGSGSRAGVAISILVKDGRSQNDGQIWYSQVGDYKTRNEKLAILQEHVDADPEWTRIIPDDHGDWLDKRDSSFTQYAPLCLDKTTAKSGSGGIGLFSMFSRGINTARDAWVYSFSRSELEERIVSMIDTYNSEVKRWESAGHNANATDFVTKDKKTISWTSTLIKLLEKGKLARMEEGVLCESFYRPFCKQHLYRNKQFLWSSFSQESLFPGTMRGQNIVIDFGTGSKPFSAIAISLVPSYDFNDKGLCIPMYWYEPYEGNNTLLAEQIKLVRDDFGNTYARHDAITDTALSVFQSAYPNAYAKRAKKYGGVGVNKEDIFYYVYGVLYSPDYRERFASNLAKELPRIPLVEDFEGFAEAGRKLADLHLHYEDLKPWPTVQTDSLPGVDPGKVVKMKWAKKKDPETGRRVNDYTTLVYNTQVNITGIPESAQNYVVNGRSPLDWMIDRYQVRKDKKSGIVNDPNDYSEDPCYIIDLVGKLVRVAMETNGIVATLPAIREIEHPANWPDAWKPQM